MCAAGKYQTGLGLVAEANCTRCAAGKYQSGSGVHGFSPPPPVEYTPWTTLWLPSVVGRVREAEPVVLSQSQRVKDNLRGKLKMIETPEESCNHECLPLL